ncbi:M23 family metallopeptidase [Desulfovibrio legallii]|uniref:M23 family metallopeptidase n=1 Tax=Desulfovibrio legallii TaxID=571438 RepID=A0A6H3FD16_9BACT|nr:M23 family metallopeptidase [Desulfovibrio legallii]TBH80747.1 M23 family metallopeptidase [Desulfovibrio legallii]CAI3238676.1 Peptidase, M23/M37 family [Desulfovibrio diazotrophicus]
MWFPKKKVWLVLAAAVVLLAVVLVRYAGQRPQIHKTAVSEAVQDAPTSSVPAQNEEGPSEQPAEAPEGAARPSADAAVSAADSEENAAAAADAAADAADAGAAPGEAVVRGTLEKGDTVGKLLAEAGSDGAQEYVSAARRVFSMRAFREGQPYVIVTDAGTGRVKRFEYEIDSRRRLVVEGQEAPSARVEAIEYVTLLNTVTATITDNLFQAVADVGESPQMALRLAELFGAEINFIRDLQPGDSFSVLVEKRYRDGDYKGYGRILAAHFTNKGSTYEAYLFHDGDNPAQYYNAKGENLRKTLLQAPLAFTRITSRFTNSRKHPILGYSRPHQGVDYAAPTGTPVKAVGRGVVTHKGWAGGYGNQIIVRHGSGLESLYSHLSGFARGLRKGQSVRQGQVIGFVGSTGLSTGPHLDFRLRQGGKFINPVKAINPRGAPVSKKSLSAFHKVMEQELAYLNGEQSLGLYTVDSLVPEAPVVISQDKDADKEPQRDKPRRRHR